MPTSMLRLSRLALALLLALLAPPALAQELPPPTQPPAVAVPGDELTVHLVTMGPGDAIWEKFGHNALWIHDARTNTDLAYNWGVFDFSSSDFLPRFLKGSMRYTLAVYPMGPMVDAYARTNRSVWVQELALTPAQKVELRDFVEWNARPENAFYTYNYFLDNCSTRVRDVLDRVLDGRLKARFDTVATATSYRWHTRRLTQVAPAMYTGMDIVLGQPGDRPITAWEEFFLPMKLRDGVRAVTVAGAGDAARPLVADERQLFAATREPEAERPANPTPWFLAAGLALGAALALLARRAARGGRLAGALFGTVGTAWSLLAGFAGLIMLLTWTVTDHTFMYRNENLLQLSPLSLLLVPLLPRLVRRGRSPLAPRLAVAVALLAALGFALQALPGFLQTNGEIIALALPVHAGIAVGAWMLARREGRTANGRH